MTGEPYNHVVETSLGRAGRKRVLNQAENTHLACLTRLHSSAAERFTPPRRSASMDAKDRRIAEQARRIAELEKKVKQLEKRPVLEADVLATSRRSTRTATAFSPRTRSSMLTRKTSQCRARAGSSATTPTRTSSSATRRSPPASRPRKPAYMERVKKTVKHFPFMELAGGACSGARSTHPHARRGEDRLGPRGEAAGGQVGASRSRAPARS